MAVTKNDVTGDKIKSKANSQAYRDNWDRIFSKKEEIKQEERLKIHEKEVNEIVPEKLVIDET